MRKFKKVIAALTIAILAVIGSANSVTVSAKENEVWIPVFAKGYENTTVEITPADEASAEHLRSDTTADIKGEWQILFTVDGPGDYLYTVKQSSEDTEKIKYDRSEYTVRIFSSYNEKGALTTETIVYKSADSKSDSIVFENQLIEPEAEGVNTGDQTNAALYTNLLMLAIDFFVIFGAVRLYLNGRND